MRRIHAIVACAAAAGGCTGVAQPVVVPELRLALTERWSGGGRLILVDERGDRWAVLSEAREGGPVRDEQAAFSPDGRWLAFVSTRGRTDDRTSLWLMPAAVGATAVRLTDGRGEDVDPTWTPDGGAIVFARRDRDAFALVRIAIDAGPAGIAPGPIETLAAGAVHHVAPDVQADGRIVYQEVDVGGGAAASRIALRDRDGAITFVTDGPLDVTPRWTPGGAALVYATGVVRDGGGRDLDLWRTTIDGDAAPLVELPGTDESGPRWSHDGRWLFATSIARDPLDGGDVPSVIYVDPAVRPPIARMLRDRAGAIPRQGPAPAALPLAADVLAAGPPYDAALAQALRDRAWERARAAVEAEAAATRRAKRRGARPDSDRERDAAPPAAGGDGGGL